jgi:hypothetical protein
VIIHALYYFVTTNLTLCIFRALAKYNPLGSDSLTVCKSETFALATLFPLRSKISTASPEERFKGIFETIGVEPCELELLTLLEELLLETTTAELLLEALEELLLTLLLLEFALEELLLTLAKEEELVVGVLPQPPIVSEPERSGVVQFFMVAAVAGLLFSLNNGAAAGAFFLCRYLSEKSLTVVV